MPLLQLSQLPLAVGKVRFQQLFVLLLEQCLLLQHADRDASHLVQHLPLNFCHLFFQQCPVAAVRRQALLMNGVLPGRNSLRRGLWNCHIPWSEVSKEFGATPANDKE